MKPSSTSIHEACHAVVAYNIGPCPTYIYSNPNKYEGYCQVDMRYRMSPYEIAKYYMAGSVGESIWCLGENGSPTNKNQISVHDLIEINKIGLDFKTLSDIQTDLPKELKKLKRDIWKVAKFLDEYENVSSAREFKMIILEDIDWIA